MHSFAFSLLYSVLIAIIKENIQICNRGMYNVDTALVKKSLVIKFIPKYHHFIYLNQYRHTIEYNY